MSRNLRYSEDELREQWSFLDALVDRQAATLRAGVQDPEDEVIESVQASEALQRELDTLRERVRVLEAERRELLERLHIAERARAAPPQARRPAPRVTEAHHVESRLRDWWRRIR